MRYLIFLIFLLGSVNVRSQDVVRIDTVSKKTLKIEKIDSGKVDLRKFDEKEVAEYSKQKDFIYDDVAPASLSWWDRFWRSFWEFIRSIFSGGGGKQSVGWFTVFLKYFSIAAAIAIIVFVVIKLIGLDLRLLFGKSKTVEVPYEESLENIHEIDFTDQLEKALQNKNYRLAVRLLYLQALKQLADQQLIDWQPEKTNITYVSELESDNHREEFAQLTYQFEYIWYGDFAVDKERFENINQSFHQFKQQLK